MTPTDSPALRDALWRAVASVRQGTALMFKGDADLIEAFLTTRPAERADSEGAAQRYVVQKQSGSRYAYVKDTQSGRILGRYDILKGVGKRNGWNLADAHADRLNNAGLRAAQQPNDGGEGL